METISWFAYVLFALTIILAIWLFSRAANYSKPVIVLILVWAALQSAMGLAGFYASKSVLSDRFPLIVLPPVVFLIGLFLSKSGRAFINKMDLKALTIFHIIRVPVEITLLFLFMAKTIPEAMTFEGRNFDIISGLTAPIVYYFAFVQRKLGRKVLIAWNVLCIILLVNVVSSAVLSLPVRYLQFGFEQSNIAVGLFPFLLLPALLVPLALFSNIVAIKQLLSADTNADARSKVLS